MSNRIAFSGKMGSGKSTAGKILAEYNNQSCTMRGLKKMTNIVSFADPIKKIARDVFHMKDKDRRLLQIIGATGRALNKNTWTNKLLGVIDAEKGNDWIVDDVRFPNEANLLKKNGFYIIRLEVSENLRRQRMQKAYEKDSDTHVANFNDASEIAMDTYEFDEIWFDPTMEELKSNCLKIVSM